MSRHAIGAIFIAAAACTSLGAQPVAAAPDLSWLAGEWVQCGPGGAVTEEHWLGTGTSLVGVNWSRSGSGQISWEHLRIGTADGRVTYFASPEGAAPTPFVLTVHQPGTAVFENRAHDFPQRITYRRAGDRLSAEATDLDGRGPSWTFRPKHPGGAC